MESLYFGNRDKVGNFIAKKYEIKDLEKFIIFKQYLMINKKSDLIQYLLECTSNNFYDTKEKIDFEFILIFFTYFINNNKPKQNIDNIQRIFDSTI